MDSKLLNEIQALRRMTVEELRQEWSGLYGEDTRSMNRDYLWKRLAWRLQELRYGGLTDAARDRLTELGPGEFVRARRPKGTVLGSAPKPKAHALAPGTILTRRYQDTEIKVRVLEDGFEWNGRTFGSLSQIAREVTGQAWSGPLFFGLRKRKSHGARKS